MWKFFPYSHLLFYYSEKREKVQVKIRIFKKEGKFFCGKSVDNKCEQFVEKRITFLEKNR